MAASVAAQLIQQQQGASKKRSRQEQVDKLAREKFQLEQQKFKQEQKEYDDELAGAGDKTFTGRALQSQAFNLLIKGAEDPAFLNTPEYALAWQKVNEPQIVRTPTGDMLIRAEIDPRFKPPTMAQAAEAKLPNSPKNPLFILPGTEKISTDQKNYNKDYQILKRSYDSMKNYLDVLEELGPQVALGPLNAKDTQRMESAYSRAMLDAKETNNLGVINGPDMEILQKLMGDPTSMAGRLRGKSALLDGGTEAMKQITDNFKALNDMVDGTPVKIRKLDKGKGEKEAPAAAMEYLKANPSTIEQFVEQFGYRPEGY